MIKNLFMALFALILVTGCNVKCDSEYEVTHVVHFAFDSSTLSEEAKMKLDVAAHQMKHADKHFLVGGHTDERGSSEYNLALGARRAKTVMDYLVGQGIHPDDIETTSFGQNMPVDPAHNESAWAKNRRVVIVAK